MRQGHKRGRAPKRVTAEELRAKREREQENGATDSVLLAHSALTAKDIDTSYSINYIL